MDSKGYGTWVASDKRIKEMYSVGAGVEVTKNCRRPVSYKHLLKQVTGARCAYKIQGLHAACFNNELNKVNKLALCAVGYK